MIRLVGSEFFKLRSTRTFYGLVAAGLGIVLLIAILVTALADFSPTDRPLRDMMFAASFVQVFVLVLGILSVTSEFRHGTITPSLLVVPHRVTLTLAKLIASVLVGLVLGLITTALVAVTVKLIGGARDLDTSGDLASLIVGGALATGLFAALGVGLGALLRNQVGAIIGALVYMFVLEPVLTAIPGIGDSVQKYGLNGVSTALSGLGEEGDSLAQVPGGLLFAAYCAVFVVAGILVTRRRDVTA